MTEPDEFSSEELRAWAQEVLDDLMRRCRQYFAEHYEFDPTDTYEEGSNQDPDAVMKRAMAEVFGDDATWELWDLGQIPKPTSKAEYETVKNFVRKVLLVEQALDAVKLIAFEATDRLEEEERIVGTAQVNDMWSPGLVAMRAVAGDLAELAPRHTVGNYLLNVRGGLGDDMRAFGSLVDERDTPPQPPR